MALKSEGTHAGEAIVSEANGSLSREVKTIVSGQVLVANTILGKITATGKYKAYENGASDGSETAVAMLVSAVDATGADKLGVCIVREAEINGAELVWKDGASGAHIAAGVADLAALSSPIIVR